MREIQRQTGFAIGTVLQDTGLRKTWLITHSAGAAVDSGLTGQGGCKLS
jgi:hypothetical protein